MECNFINLLCLEGEVHPFYGKNFTNKLTHQKIKVAKNLSLKRPKEDFWVIRDIPDYIDISLNLDDRDLQLKKIPQYKGYLVNLTKFKDANDFFTKTLSRNPRKNFRAKLRKLESNHSIGYQFYYGKIDKNHYDYLFDVSYNLMEARFRQKKIYNRYLLDWKYYHDLFYTKILAKEASICVIYDSTKPITITLNFHKGDIVFSFIQIYDTNYYKYSMGDIAMFKNIEWSYANNYKVWDVSKGITNNKLRWCNHIYQFDYQIFYNAKSITSRIRTFLISLKLKGKQLLRDKGIIGGVFQLDTLYYYTKMKQLKDHDWRES